MTDRSFICDRVDVSCLSEFVDGRHLGVTRSIDSGSDRCLLRVLVCQRCRFFLVWLDILVSVLMRL